MYDFHQKNTQFVIFCYSRVPWFCLTARMSFDFISQVLQCPVYIDPYFGVNPLKLHNLHQSACFKFVVPRIYTRHILPASAKIVLVNSTFHGSYSNTYEYGHFRWNCEFSTPVRLP